MTGDIVLLRVLVVCRASLVLFFFSSRRRHTRYIGDWSSDVCSSDLFPARSSLCRRAARARSPRSRPRSRPKIGRASCRERVSLQVVAVACVNTEDTLTYHLTLQTLSV